MQLVEERDLGMYTPNKFSVHDQTLKTIVLQAQHLPKPTGMKTETLKREEKGRWKSFLRVPHLSSVPMSTGGNPALVALPLPPPS